MVLFIVLVSALSLTVAITISIVVGLSMLAVLSYYIAVSQKKSILWSMAQHLGIAVLVILVAHFLGQLIGSLFHV
jgi:VIT1/CCC1 family predicted Fe2+/Mn2+ transporter